MRRLFALALLLPAFAVADETPDTPMELRVKPVLCIIDKRNPSCDMSFLVVWATGKTGYYCLFNDFGDAPIRCWREEHDGELTDRRNVEKTFSFWMTDEDFASRLAQVEVEVLQMDSDDRRRKRRSRHVWDIN